MATAVDLALNLVRRDVRTVPLLNSKLFIGGPCPILVLTTVLGHPCRTGF